LELTDLIPSATVRKLPDLSRPNRAVEVWGRIKLTKSPRKPAKRNKAQQTSLTLEGLIRSAKARQKPGPKSLRPFWEQVLGRSIPDVVWSSAMKATQIQRGAKPITREALLARIHALEGNPHA
jgi:hypothetical protein